LLLIASSSAVVTSLFEEIQMVIMVTNKAAMSLLFGIVLSAISCRAFSPGSVRVERATALQALDRRAFVAAGIAGAASTLFADASSASQPKVLVVGGTGMVGSEVVKILKGMGVEVVATSTDGRDGTEALDFRTENNLAAAIESLAKGCTAVISCVGVVGTEEDAMVNSASGIAAFSARNVGVKHFSYVSVAPEVREFAKSFDFLDNYMAGKAYSESSIQRAFGSGEGSFTLIEPTFIYGGDKFALNPPRVASGYGQIIEGLLSSPPFRAATNIAPEGIIKIALEPPVSASSVAKAAIAGAIGKSCKFMSTASSPVRPSSCLTQIDALTCYAAVSVLDTYDKIIEASKLI
jgi:uncharacterized protein YbjT (DUF2867 family)